MKKKLQFLLLITAIIGFAFSPKILFAQQLFSVSYNNLSKEFVTQLKTQTEKAEIPLLSLTRNNEGKSVYSFAFSSVENSRIIILNEQTESYAELIPVAEHWRTTSQPSEFQLAPFFMEELKQGVLGEADRYLIVEARLTASQSNQYAVKNISSVAISSEAVYIPRYFYGEKENVLEALPQDRKIIGICKAKPRLISAFPDDPEFQKYIAQLEEEQSYYIYVFKLPNGIFCTYDEHFNPDSNTDLSIVDGPLQFNLVGQMTATERAATVFALQLWSNKLAGKVPIDIQVDLKQKDPGVLGSSYVQPHFASDATQTWYPSTLWNQLVGYDATTKRDIRIEMNSIFSWYFGTDGNPPYNKYDFISTMLHEVNHGLGFAENIDPDNGKFLILNWQDNIWYNTSWPGIFDRQLYQGVSGPSIPELTDAGRKAVIVSNNLYAGRPGSKLLAANGGNRVKMYAPNPYNDGSSVCHWDESVTFKTFMKYSGGPGVSGTCHTINAYEMGMLLDMGWKESVGECKSATNLTVTFSGDCKKATLNWNVPATRDPNALLWDNTAGQIQSGYHGTRWMGGTSTTRLVMADDFDVPAGEIWTIQEVNFYGFPSFTPPSPQPERIGIAIYKDNGSNRPQTSPIYEEATFIPNGGFTNGNMTVAISSGISITTPGKYWISIYGAYNGAFNSDKQYYIGIASSAKGATMCRWDPENKYGNGSFYPDWKPNTDAGYPSMFFSLTGQKAAGGATFNVYRDGSKIAGPITGTTYQDASFDYTKQYTWSVRTVCNGGVEAEPTSFKPPICTVGIDENEDHGIMIVPNPTTGQLTINNGQLTIKSVEIYDVFGRKLLEEKENLTGLQFGKLTASRSYDLTVFPAGIYFLKITTETGMVTKKVIKH